MAPSSTTDDGIDTAITRVPLSSGRRGRARPRLGRGSRLTQPQPVGPRRRSGWGRPREGRSRCGPSRRARSRRALSRRARSGVRSRRARSRGARSRGARFGVRSRRARSRSVASTVVLPGRPVSGPVGPRPARLGPAPGELRGPVAQGGAHAGEEDGTQKIVSSQELGDRAFEADLPALEEEGMLGQRHGAVHALLHQDHGGPVGVHPTDDVHEALHRHRRKTEGELVDHEESGLGHHHPGQSQHLLLAARQRPRRLVEAVLELGEEADGFVEGDLGPGGVASERVLPDAEVLPDRQARERHLPPHEQRRAQVDDLFRLEVRAVGAEDADDPAMGMVEPGHGPQQGALARTVGAQQRHDVALGDLQVHVEQDLLRPVVEVHVVDLQGRDLSARLASLPFRVALQDVLDYEGDVTPHEA